MSLLRCKFRNKPVVAGDYVVLPAEFGSDGESYSSTSIVEHTEKYEDLGKVCLECTFLLVCKSDEVQRFMIFLCAYQSDQSRFAVFKFVPFSGLESLLLFQR